MSRLGTSSVDKKGFNGKTFAKVVSATPSLSSTETSLVIGQEADRRTNGRNNIFIGNSSGSHASGPFNTVIGNDSGRLMNINSRENVYIGNTAGALCIGISNVCVGFSSGQLSKGGSNNTYVGYESGQKLSGRNNTVIGYKACSSISAAGSNNIIIGASSGDVSGSNNIIIGTELFSDGSAIENQISIGNVFNANTQHASVQLNLATTGGVSDGTLVGIKPDGNLYRHSKTFVIEHPTSPSRYLVHSCIEGDKNNVCYHGIATLSKQDASGNFVCFVELPHYFSSLVDESKSCVQATPDSKALCWTSSIQTNCFCIYATASCKVRWLVVAERKDVPALVTEPEKKSCYVAGRGPYTYISQFSDT